MPYYKSVTNEVYYLAPEDSESFLPSGCVQIDDEEASSLRDASLRAFRDGRAEAQEYLRATDWYVIRQMETGEPIPEDISAARAEARSKA